MPKMPPLDVEQLGVPRPARSDKAPMNKEGRMMELGDLDQLLKERISLAPSEITQQALHWAIVALDTVACETMTNEFMRTQFAARCRDVLLEFIKEEPRS
jgi:hypothetical protein